MPIDSNIFKSKIEERKERTTISTWNVHYQLTDSLEKQILIKDMENHKITVAALQETRCMTQEFTHENAKLIMFEGKNPTNIHKRYGMGFYVAKQWIKYIKGSEYISDRICIIHFDFEKAGSKNLSIINVYAPTTEVANNDRNTIANFYRDLTIYYDKYSSDDNIVIIAGDFNAKVGKRQDLESCIGQHGKGIRNNNGNDLIDFLTEKNLFITNTHYRHPPKHVTTWHGPPERRDRLGKRIHNLIDYIIIPKSALKALTNARAYRNQAHPSDHSLVAATFNFNNLNIYIAKYRKYPSKKKYDTSALANDKELKEKYQTKLSHNITLTLPNLTNTNLIQYNNTITNIIQKTIKQTLPKAPTYQNGQVKFYDNPLLIRLVQQRKHIKLQIDNTKNPIEIQQFKTYYTHIGNRVKQIKNQYTETGSQKLQKTSNKIKIMPNTFNTKNY